MYCMHKISIKFTISRTRAIASMGQGGAIAPPILGVAPQSGLAPATVVSLRLAMGQLRLEKCIKTIKIQ